MDYQYLIKKIQKNLTKDLLQPQYRNSKSKYVGHCYVASETFYHLVGGKTAGFKPMFVKHENQNHWWIKGPGESVIDITAKQFKTEIPYHKSVGKGFLTKNPSKRSKILINRLKQQSC